MTQASAVGTSADRRSILSRVSNVYLWMGQLALRGSGPTDEALLARMAVGEQAAAVAFVRRYQRRVFGLAYSMTSDPGLAE